MKKIFTAVLLPIIVLLSASCVKTQPLFKNFSELQSEYETIVSVVKDYHTAQKQAADDRITISISDGELVDADGNPVSLSAEQSRCLKRINSESYTDYDFLWVSDDYVIFWKDETKYYGLLFADDPKTIINDFKSDWFDGIEYNKINDKWYEIGVF